MSRIGDTWIFLLLLLAVSQHSWGDTPARFTAIAGRNPSSDELYAQLLVPRAGSYSLTCRWADSSLFLPVNELFTDLRINHKWSEDRFRIEGFFPTDEKQYVIDADRQTITIDSRTVTLSRRDFFLAESELYIRSDILAGAFGFRCQFDYASLELTLNASPDAPIFLQMAREQARLRLEAPADESEKLPVIPLNRKLLGGSMLDWSINSSLSAFGPYNAFSLSYGGLVASGEMEVWGTGNDHTGFDSKQTRWRWRYAPESGPVRQVALGGVQSDPLGPSGGFDVDGVLVTNRPAATRRIYGTRTISDRPGPGWDADLYVNDELTAFTRTGPDGYYRFDLPVRYGSTLYTVKTYGPLGEERRSDSYLSIPFTFIPAGEFEYSLLGGRLRNYDQNPFAEAIGRVGLLAGVTVGGGIRYLDAPGISRYIPCVNASVRVSDQLLVTTDYTSRVSNRWTLSAASPAQTSVDFGYTAYAENAFFNPSRRRSEARFSAMIPYRSQLFTLSSRLMLSRTTYLGGQSTQGEITLSGFVGRIQGTIATRWLWSQSGPDVENRTASTLVRVSTGLAGGLIARPFAEYDHQSGGVIRSGVELERSVLREGWISLSAERSYRSNSTAFAATFRYDLPFAQVSSSAHATGQSLSYQQSLRGFLGFDGGTGTVVSSSQSWVRQGALTVIPFIDLNGNGRWDDGEPLAEHVVVRIDGGRVLRGESDSPTRIFGLEAYNMYTLTLDPQSLDNPLWMPAFTTCRVSVDPNEFKTVSIPILVAGEIDGRVRVDPSLPTLDLGGLRLHMVNTGGGEVTSVTVSPSGAFSIAGLRPGRYRLYIDSLQLRDLGASSAPESLRTDLLPTREGDIVDGLQFTLSVKPRDIALGEGTVRKPAAAGAGMYGVQIGSFRMLKNADQFLQIVRGMSDQCVIVGRDVIHGYFSVRFVGFRSVRSARQLRDKLRNESPALFHDAFVVRSDGSY